VPADSPASIAPPGWSTRLPHLVTGLLVIGLFGFSLATYQDLPARIPIHFDGSGNPDGWAAKGWLTWLALPLTAVGMWLLMSLSAKVVDWARRHPRWLNLPYKEKFLALPPERQEPLWQRMKALVLWMAPPVVALLGYAQVSIQRAARGPGGQMAVWPMFALLGGMLLAVVWLTVGLVRAVKRTVDG